MSYVLIGLIGAATGWVMGQFVTGSRQAIAIDVIAGAIGAWLTVLLCRAVIPVMAGNSWISAIAAVTGAVVTLLVLSRFLREKLMNSSRGQRR
jgi:uncharacterized membrane protein YeaQ/YmgE (transglycosylase-associated protein family)